MSDLEMSDGPDGPFRRIAKVEESTMYMSGEHGHSAIYFRDGRTTRGWDPKIPALAEAIARQRHRDERPPDSNPETPEHP